MSLSPRMCACWDGAFLLVSCLNNTPFEWRDRRSIRLFRKQEVTVEDLAGLCELFVGSAAAVCVGSVAEKALGHVAPIIDVHADTGGYTM